METEEAVLPPMVKSPGMAPLTAVLPSSSAHEHGAMQRKRGKITNAEQLLRVLLMNG